ncbi:MAG: hypothetical protein JWO32_1834 [Bacteroidetes bacterium]|nr:hypothetical protein [Bacteroidota bacterium]
MDKQGIRKLLNLDVASTSPTIIIYSEQVTNRLNYVCRFIFEHVLKIKYVVTSGRDEFESSGFYKINYSHSLSPQAFHILPQGLLFQKGISEVKPSVKKKNNSIYFFNNSGSDLHFDIFSAVFFMISRYEEWQPFKPDVHGRFELSHSLLYKNQAHLMPVVDHWIMELRASLARFYPGIVLPVLEFKTISTIDVDNLFAFSNKGFLRTTGGFLKDVMKGDFKNFKQRLNIIRHPDADPFDIYESFTKYCKDINVPLIYFFLFRSGTKFDRTINPQSSVFKTVFKKIKSNNGIIGLHPSYFTVNTKTRLSSEVKDFSNALNNEVILSRQHYLRFNIQTTPIQLLNEGIVADFTMGFASGAGFRAGTTHPFFYYDFHNEMDKDLLMVPFCAMDGAYTVYMKNTTAEVAEALQKLKNEVKKVNGLFITVFHERTFSEDLYPGFGQMYKSVLKD